MLTYFLLQSCMYVPEETARGYSNSSTNQTQKQVRSQPQPSSPLSQRDRPPRSRDLVRLGSIRM